MENIVITKELIKTIMATTNQKLIYEDNNNLEYENPMFGETICFEFNNNILVRVYS